MPKIIGPFLNLGLGPEGKASGEVVRLLKEDLRRVDDDAFDWGGKDDLRRKGIEGHLVIRLELVEVVRAWGGGGCLSVHDEEIIAEGDDPVEMAAKDVGLCG